LAGERERKMKQKQEQVLGINARNELIQMKKNKIQVWQEAEDRAKQYLMSARKKRKEAEKELRELIDQN
jgi:hypothetical protein